jgi:damage-control phosphatase, subfamily III
MRFAEPFAQSGKSPEAKLEAERLMFLELTQGLVLSLNIYMFTNSLPWPVCLWGNSTDLSLLIDMSEEQIKSLQSTGGDHLAATEKNILGNHLSQLWEAVKDLREKTGGRIDFILDNAGFELYCDCVYGSYDISCRRQVIWLVISADFLIQSGLAKQIRFHGKRYPWFVSDVTRTDWEWLLNTMVYGHLFPKATEQERESLRRLGLRWKVR